MDGYSARRPATKGDQGTDLHCSIAVPGAIPGGGERRRSVQQTIYRTSYNLKGVSSDTVINLLEPVSEEAASASATSSLH